MADGGRLIMADGGRLIPAPARLRAMLYLLTPNESSFEMLHDVPAYVHQVGLRNAPVNHSTETIELCFNALHQDRQVAN